MAERRCLFCGEPFTGQNHNFEHVIPRWLVREADLSKRTAPIDFPTKQFSAAMSRIGGRSCEICNDLSSDLERQASISYAKLRDGDVLTSSDGRSLLDWLDKVRVGLWLWSVDVGKDDWGLIPKFRINERMAHKDRILLAAKYPPGPRMKGLGIWGATQFFMWSPSAIGFLINNIALVSVSTDFLVSRHLSNLSIKHYMYSSGDISAEIDLADEPGKRLKFFAAPLIIGQVILPVDLFDEYGLAMANRSALHPGWGEGPVLKLNGNLEEIGPDLGSLPTFAGNASAHRIIMEFYLDLASKYVLDNFLAADFSRILSPERREAVQTFARENLAEIERDIDRATTRYRQITGITLPT
ncbi:hypothetical protein V1292_002583 [Bradyrhizobium sp. AZCC 1719]|uniref:HNH endonuclease n=1 Tax=Bradyrhizobium sp. AZCC 1719 TaxID=3117028 RepID=UPI002FF42DF0